MRFDKRIAEARAQIATLREAVWGLQGRGMPEAAGLVLALLDVERTRWDLLRARQARFCGPRVGATGRKQRRDRVQLCRERYRAALDHWRRQQGPG